MRIAVEGKRVNSHRSVGAGGDVVDLSDWVVSLWVGFCCKIKILRAKEVATPHGRFTSILQDPTCESIFTCHARPASRMRGICKGAGEWSRHSRCKYIMSSLCKIQQENYMHAYENIDNLLLKKKIIRAHIPSSKRILYNELLVCIYRRRILGKCKCKYICICAWQDELSVRKVNLPGTGKIRTDDARCNICARGFVAPARYEYNPPQPIPTLLSPLNLKIMHNELIDVWFTVSF